MNTQLSIFQSPPRRKIQGNPYRDARGRYCSKREADEAAREMEMRKLKDKSAYWERKAEMYERAYLSVVKQLRQSQIK